MAHRNNGTDVFVHRAAAFTFIYVINRVLYAWWLTQSRSTTLRTSLIDSELFHLIYMFAVLNHWWVEVLHTDRTWTKTEPRVRLLERKTGLTPPPPCNLLLIVPKRWFCCDLFQLSISVHFLFVFDLLFNLFRIVLWPNCWERAVPLAFHLFCFYFSAVLIVGVSFPFGV